jgi:hypothetical protein
MPVLTALDRPNMFVKELKCISIIWNEIKGVSQEITAGQIKWNAFKKQSDRRNRVLPVPVYTDNW